MLHIYPGSDTSIISCELSSYDVQKVDAEKCGFGKQISYTALSYTWGDPTPICHVSINKRTLKIGANLFAALLQLRDPEKVKTVWADAICIDQSNLEERSQQVSLMALIYQNASLVVVWLGEWSKNSRLAFECLKKSLEYKFDIEAIESSSEEFKAIENLFERPWWERIWVLQEVCFAFNVEFWCGSDSMSWEALYKGMLNVPNRFMSRKVGMDLDGSGGRDKPVYTLKGTPERQFHDTYFPMRKPNDKLRQMSAKVDELAMWKERRECKALGMYGRHGGSSLDAVLQHYASRAASDPRDKVYALLSFTDPADSDFKIVPNYTLSVREVYLSTVREWILKKHTLDIITTRPSAPKNIDLPSWTPDWTASFPSDDPLDLHIYHASYGGVLDCENPERGSVKEQCRAAKEAQRDAHSSHP